VLEVLFTSRKPNAQMSHGGYQVTCYHHAPDTGAGASGRAALRCVKELPCEEEGDDARLLAFLTEWACSAGQHDTRREHMASVKRQDSRRHLAECIADAMRLESPAPSSTTVASSIRSPGAGAGSDSSQAPPAASADRGSEPPATRSPAARAGSDRPEAPPVAGSDRSSEALPIPCDVCGGGHARTACPYDVRAAIAQSLAGACMRVRGRDGVVLPRHLVQKRDVEADGDCFFHAAQRELKSDKHLLPGMPQGEDGQPLRKWLLRYLTSTDDRAEGRPLADWLETSPEEHVREMRRGDVTDTKTWGGFLEAFFIATALQTRGVSILMLDDRADGYHALAWTAPGGGGIRSASCASRGPARTGSALPCEREAGRRCGLTGSDGRASTVGPPGRL
jgi:hypothetical protein